MPLPRCHLKALSGQALNRNRKKQAAMPCMLRQRTAGCSSFAGSSGFTLLELLVVVALIALVGALAMPRLQIFLQGDALQASARQTIGFLQQTAQLARQERQAYTLRYAGEQHALVAEAVEAARLQKRNKGQNPGRARSLRLPETVELAGIHSRERQHARQKERGQEPRLYINSKGYSEPALIVLAARDGKRQLSLAASPFLGRVKVVEGYADPASAELFR